MFKKIIMFLSDVIRKLKNAVLKLFLSGRNKKKEKEALLQQAVSEMAANASVFIGLYEPMRMIRDGQLKFGEGVFTDWDVRVCNTEDAPALAAHWNGNFSGFKNWKETEYAKKAGELLEFAKMAGIVRGEETEVTVEKSIFRLYFVKNSVPIDPGTLAKVETPYWMAGKNVLEKGIITV
jgi:hypothetical protein